MSMERIKKLLFERYPCLESCREDIEKAYKVLRDSYINQGKLLVAGNGGSASDSEHIVGELMKSFLIERKVGMELEEELVRIYGTEGEKLAGMLEGALPVIPLTSMPALTSAFSNDVNSAAVFAQMVYAYGRPGDVMLGISTSGNSENILYAFMVAHAKGLATIALTGCSGGKCRGLADIAVCVPEKETFRIQELHLPIYHALCAMLEADFFEFKAGGKYVAD